MINMRMLGPVEPPNPALGDCYYSSETGTAFIWMDAWIPLISNTEEFSGVYVIQEEP